MKITRVIFFTTSLFIFSNCTHKGESSLPENENNIDIPPRKIEVPVFSQVEKIENSLDFFAQDIKVVKLETNKNCYLTDNIRNIAISDRYIFIAEFKYIYQFDIHGNFIRKIGNNGNGPGEFVQVNDMQIDWSKKIINIFPGMTKGKIIKYDFNGNYLGDILFDSEDFIGFDILEDSYIFHPFSINRFRPDCSLLFRIDSIGIKTKVKSSIYPFNNKGLQRGMRLGDTRNWSWWHNKQLYLVEEGNDTIYEISKDSVLYRGILSGKNKLSLQKLYSKEDLTNSDYIMLSNKAFGPINSCIYESNRYLILRCKKGDTRYLAIYDKIEGQMYRTNYKYTKNDLVNSDAFFDDILSGLAISPQKQISKGRFITIIFPLELLEKRKDIENFYLQNPNPRSKKLLHICDQISNDDNPVMFIVSLK